MPRLKPEHVDPTDAEEADIQGQIAEDPDDPAHWERGQRAIPPGEHLRDILASQGISQRVLAQKIGRPPQTVNGIIRGIKAITPQTALELERALGIDAEYWLGLEWGYQLASARATEAKGQRSLPWRTGP